MRATMADPTKFPTKFPTRFWPSGLSPAKKSALDRSRFQKVLLTLGLLALATFAASARLPAPHQHQGAIAFVDLQTHTLILAAAPKPKLRLGSIVKPSTFVWTEQTQFISKGLPFDPARLASGEEVRLYYHYRKAKQPPVLLKLVRLL
jgi:hypothetical protein